MLYDQETISEARAASAAAYAAYEAVCAEIKNAEAAVIANAPAAAVAAGTKLAEAAKAQAEARQHLEFYQEAKPAAWQRVLDAEAALNSAHLHAQWANKLQAAIDARIKACEAHDLAQAAVEQAQTDYKNATKIITEAHGAGMPKPVSLREQPLSLSLGIDHLPRFRMRTAAQERAIWEISE